jgi:hypothetical protein
MDARKALGKKTHLGATAGLDFGEYGKRLAEEGLWQEERRAGHIRAVTKLMGMKYMI